MRYYFFIINLISLDTKVLGDTKFYTKFFLSCYLLKNCKIFKNLNISVPLILTCTKICTIILIL